MPTDKKSAKRPGRIKDLKSKKVGPKQASGVKGGVATILKNAVVKLADPRPDPAIPTWWG